MAFGQGKLVTVVNRVVNDKGERVPQECMYGGEATWIRDSIDVPVGIARILVHQSMYKLDALTGIPMYKLGCKSFENCPVDDLPVKEIDRLELVDRPEGAERKMVVKRINNPINPGQSRGPAPIRASAEGAQPGEFGFRD